MENWGFGRWCAAVIASFAVVFGLVVVGHGIAYGEWQINWWYQQQNVNRHTNLTLHGVGNQVALRSDIGNQISQVDKYTSEISEADAEGYTSYASTLYAPRYDAANTACQDIAQLTTPAYEAEFTDWSKANCQYGTVSPHSKYYKTQP